MVDAFSRYGYHCRATIHYNPTARTPGGFHGCICDGNVRFPSLSAESRSPCRLKRHNGAAVLVRLKGGDNPTVEGPPRPVKTLIAYDCLKFSGGKPERGKPGLTPGVILRIRC